MTLTHKFVAAFVLGLQFQASLFASSSSNSSSNSPSNSSSNSPSNSSSNSPGSSPGPNPSGIPYANSSAPPGDACDQICEELDTQNAQIQQQLAANLAALNAGPSGTPSGSTFSPQPPLMSKNYCVAHEGDNVSYILDSALIALDGQVMIACGTAFGLAQAATIGALDPVLVAAAFTATQVCLTASLAANGAEISSTIVELTGTTQAYIDKSAGTASLTLNSAQALFSSAFLHIGAQETLTEAEEAELYSNPEAAPAMMQVTGATLGLTGTILGIRADALTNALDRRGSTCDVIMNLGPKAAPTPTPVAYQDLLVLKQAAPQSTQSASSTELPGLNNKNLITQLECFKSNAPSQGCHGLSQASLASAPELGSADNSKRIDKFLGQVPANESQQLYSLISKPKGLRTYIETLMAGSKVSNKFLNSVIDLAEAAKNNATSWGAKLLPNSGTKGQPSPKAGKGSPTPRGNTTPSSTPSSGPFGSPTGINPYSNREAYEFEETTDIWHENSSNNIFQIVSGRLKKNKNKINY